MSEPPARLPESTGEVPAISPAPLPFHLSALRTTGRGVDPFVIAGRRAFALGSEDTGVHCVCLDGLHALHDTRLHDAVFQSVEVTALGTERQLLLHGAQLLERVHIPREQPAAILEWTHTRSIDGAAAAVELRFTWQIQPSPVTPEPPPAWRRQGGALILSHAGRVIACLSDHNAQLEASETAQGLHCQLRARLAPGESVRLLVTVAAGAGDAVASAFVPLRDPAALVRAAGAGLRRLRHERLSLDAPDERAGEAIEWVKYRLDRLRIDVPGGRSMVAGFGCPGTNGNGGRDCALRHLSSDAAWSALAALATGDFEAARDLVRCLGSLQQPDGAIPLAAPSAPAAASQPDIEATALWLLLVARTLAWTGDLAFVSAAWPRVRAAADCLRAASPRAGDARGLGPVALRELAIAAESVGNAGLARAAGDAASAGSAATRPAVTTGAWPGVVARNLEGGVSRHAIDGWRSWSAYANGRPESAFALWRGLLEGGFAAARGSWPDVRDSPDGPPVQAAASGSAARGCVDHALSAAAAIWPLAFGLLGADPDALRHRLRLRPQLPQEWDRLDVRGLCVGNAVFALRYRRAAASHVFTVSQESGAVPFRLVLEPAIASGITRVRLDGQDASLDVRRFGERWLVPVQLMAERERSIEITSG